MRPRQLTLSTAFAIVSGLYPRVNPARLTSVSCASRPKRYFRFHARLSHKPPAVRHVLEHPGMPQNFLTCDRDQAMLLPPDLRDWLDDDHLAWFVIDAVSELDLEPFYASYRTDGHGAAAHEPQMMVTLFAYAYAVGERSARQIDRRCREDVAFRVICADQAPDHA